MVESRELVQSEYQALNQQVSAIYYTDNAMILNRNSKVLKSMKDVLAIWRLVMKILLVVLMIASHVLKARKKPLIVRTVARAFSPSIYLSPIWRGFV